MLDYNLSFSRRRLPAIGLSVVGLRRERDRNRLIIVKIAGRIHDGPYRTDAMPRRSKGARLQLKAARGDESGDITHVAT